MSNTLACKHIMRDLLTKADSYLPKDPAICLEQLQQQVSVLDNGNDEEKGLYYLTEGKAYFLLGKTSEAKISLEKGLKTNISELTQARLNMWLACVFAQNHETVIAKTLLVESIHVLKKLDRSIYLADALCFRGLAFINESNFTEGLNSLMESLDLAVKFNLSFTETRASSLIAVIYYWLDDLEKGKEWLKRSYAISKEKGYVRMTIANRINYANIDILSHQPKIAIEKLKEAKHLIINSGYKWDSLLTSTLNNIGSAYIHEKNLYPIKALKYFHQGLELSEQIKKKSSICHALLGISNSLLLKDKAEYPFSTLYTKEWIENKLANLRELVGDDDSLMLNKTVLEAQINFYKYLGDFEKAFQNLEKLMVYNEKYLKKEKIDSVKILQSEYDLQQQELEYQKLELKQKEELEKINKSLEIIIAERTNDLRSKNKELQEYAYIVAHDLKEPIRSIVSFSQLLERKIKDKLNLEEKELLNFIKDSGMNMGDLVEALLQYSTVNIDYEFLPKHNINDIITETVRNIDYSIKLNNAEIKINLLNDKIKCDKIKISQLFQNIISNAIKFKKKDSIVKINISCEKVNNEYLFTIKDNGIGIEKDYYKNIFKLFKRLNKNENYEGTGIGLSVSKKIVEQHGGKIWLESVFGQGTTFYFTLPDHE